MPCVAWHISYFSPLHVGGRDQEPVERLPGERVRLIAGDPPLQRGHPHLHLHQQQTVTRFSALVSGSVGLVVWLLGSCPWGLGFESISRQFIFFVTAWHCNVFVVCFSGLRAASVSDLNLEKNWALAKLGFYNWLKCAKFEQEKL